jgi:ethanolamine phosphate transferase 2 subunit G
MAAEAGERLPIWLQHIPYAWPWIASLVAKARLSFFSIAVGLTWYSIRWVRDLKNTQSWITGSFSFLNLFLLGQTRYANIPLFLLFEGQRWLLEMSHADQDWLVTTSLWMQHVSFFALGNSNSLSSVDLTNAYNGISSYSIPLVGTLTFISNWAGPIWWSSAAIRFYLDRRATERYVDWMSWSSWFHGLVMCFLVGACIILRTHLFIWTVFSPKFLFQAVWMALQHLVVEGIVGGIICLIG